MTDTRDKFETLRENPFVQDEEDTDEGRTGAPDDSEFTAPPFPVKVTTKLVPHLGHNVFVDGKEVGTITNYSGSWWALRPERFPLGARNKQHAAELLAEQVTR